MGTECNDNASDRELRSLMRLLTNLNAGAMLALCLWLAWMATDHKARDARLPGVIAIHGCGCTMSEVTDGSGLLDVASGR